MFVDVSVLSGTFAGLGIHTSLPAVPAAAVDAAAGAAAAPGQWCAYILARVAAVRRGGGGRVRWPNDISPCQQTRKHSPNQ